MAGHVQPEGIFMKRLLFACLALLCAPWRPEIAPDDPGVDLQKRPADVPGEGKIHVPVAGVVL